MIRPVILWGVEELKGERVKDATDRFLTTGIDSSTLPLFHSFTLPLFHSFTLSPFRKGDPPVRCHKTLRLISRRCTFSIGGLTMNGLRPTGCAPAISSSTSPSNTNIGLCFTNKIVEANIWSSFLTRTKEKTKKSSSVSCT